MSNPLTSQGSTLNELSGLPVLTVELDGIVGTDPEAEPMNFLLPWETLQAAIKTINTQTLNRRHMESLHDTKAFLNGLNCT